jgi:hypothetical protein
MLEEPKMKTLVQTKWLSKKIFPSFYWWYTFYEMQNDARKMNGKTKRGTNGLQKKSVLQASLNNYAS